MNLVPKINYQHLAHAERWYGECGFEICHMPWVTTETIVNMTLPKGATPTKIEVPGPQKILVGSAEQSFLHCSYYNTMHGKFQAITPCFRDDAEDEWHFKYFMKHELFQNDIVNSDELYKLIEKARQFFSFYLPVEVITTPDPTSYASFDIVDSKFKIELGSYGIRSVEQIGPWIYGTGCAEPRLSQVLQKIAESHHA